MEEAAERHLGVSPPQGGFFLWLKVDDDVHVVKRLMTEQAVLKFQLLELGMQDKQVLLPQQQVNLVTRPL